MTEPTIAISTPATGEEEWQALREPLLTGWLVQGPHVAAFERAFAERHRVRHARAVTSGTTALHLALLALGIGPGDEVVVPSFTWVATPNAVLYCGATPIFADIDPRTFNLDPADLRRRLTPRTRAVVAVHLFGLPADVDAIRAVAPDITLVEDAACAAGAEYKGTPVGGLGRVAAFSFHPRKAITTGEGGMVTTDDEALAEKVSVLRNHGAHIGGGDRSGSRPDVLPDFDDLGYNYRMTDLQAAIGQVQLGKMDGFIEERSRWARYYERELSGLPGIGLPRAGDGARHSWQSYVLTVDPARASRERGPLMHALQERGIQTRPGTHACHMLGLYRERFGVAADAYPRARDAGRHSMAIPLHNRMVEADYSRVVRALRELSA